MEDKNARREKVLGFIIVVLLLVFAFTITAAFLTEPLQIYAMTMTLLLDFILVMIIL